MLYLLVIFVFLAVIYNRRQISAFSIGVSLNLGAVIAIFSSPFWGTIATILFAYLASHKSP